MGFKKRIGMVTMFTLVMIMSLLSVNAVVYLNETFDTPTSDCTTYANIFGTGTCNVTNGELILQETGSGITRIAISPSVSYGNATTMSIGFDFKLNFFTPSDTSYISTRDTDGSVSMQSLAFFYPNANIDDAYFFSQNDGGFAGNPCPQW